MSVFLAAHLQTQHRDGHITSFILETFSNKTGELSVYGKMSLFQNIPVTHLEQNRLEYSGFDAWKPDTTEIVHAVEFLQ